MKQTFLSTLIVFIFIIVFNSSCKKEPPYMSNAIITGPDVRVCICCGGLMITFNGETKPYSGDFKLVDNVSDLKLTDKDTFPLYVKVDWKADATNVCEHIIITRMARR